MKKYNEAMKCFDKALEYGCLNEHVLAHEEAIKEKMEALSGKRE